MFTLTDQNNNPAEIRKYRVDIYYVSPCQVPVAVSCDANADGGTPIPTLKRLTLSIDNNGNLVWRNEPLAAGIENLQFDYGIDNDGDGIPDTYTISPADTTAWSNVVALEINVLARNIEPTPGYTDSKSYDMGLAGPFVAANTGFKRHVFAAQIRAINPASRREVP